MRFLFIQWCLGCEAKRQSNQSIEELQTQAWFWVSENSRYSSSLDQVRCVIYHLHSFASFIIVWQGCSTSIRSAGAPGVFQSRFRNTFPTFPLGGPSDRLSIRFDSFRFVSGSLWIPACCVHCHMRALSGEARACGSTRPPQMCVQHHVNHVDFSAWHYGNGIAHCSWRFQCPSPWGELICVHLVPKSKKESDFLAILQFIWQHNVINNTGSQSLIWSLKYHETSSHMKPCSACLRTLTAFAHKQRQTMADWWVMAKHRQNTWDTAETPLNSWSPSVP